MTAAASNAHTSSPTASALRPLAYRPPEVAPRVGRATSEPHGLALLDAEGRILWSNTVFGRLMGESAAALTGRRTRLFCPEGGDASHVRSIREVLRQHGRFVGQLPTRRADGRVVRLWVILKQLPAGVDGVAPLLLRVRASGATSRAPAPQTSGEQASGEQASGEQASGEQASGEQGTLATQALGAASPGQVLSTLHEALHDRAGGEVIARSGATVGRIYVHQGRIAWAHLSTLPSVLTDALRSEGISAEALQDVLAECKRTGGNVGETLIARGLLSRERMREVLRRHVAARLQALMQLDMPVVLFAPQARRYGSELLFSVEELLE